MLGPFLNRLLAYLERQNLSFAIVRNYHTLPETLHGGDIDFLVAQKHVPIILQYLSDENIPITSFSQQLGCLNLFLSLSSKHFVQIDLIHEVQYLGIPYLTVETVLSKRIPYKNFYICAPQHEYFFNLLPFYFYTGRVKEKYRDRQEELYQHASYEIDEIQHRIFGSAHGKGKRQFLWKHRAQLHRLSRHYGMELHKYIHQPYSQTVVLLGPDGAGKSTILEHLMDRCALFAKSNSFQHLKPRYLLKQRIQHRGVVTEPHAKEPRSELYSAFKLLVYVQEYWIEHFLKPERNAHLKLYDRYFHDILIDARRYRLSDNSRIPQYLTPLVPQPRCFIVLNADPSVIQSRKAEVSFASTQKQCASYLNFAQQHPKRCIVVDANQNIETVVEEIIEKLRFFLDRKNRYHLQKAYTDS